MNFGNFVLFAVAASALAGTSCKSKTNTNTSMVASAPAVKPMHDIFLMDSEKNIRAANFKGHAVLHLEDFAANSQVAAQIIAAYKFKGTPFPVVRRNGIIAILLPDNLYSEYFASLATRLTDSCSSECGASAIAGAMTGALGGAAAGSQVGAAAGPQGAAGGAVIGGFIGGIAGGMGGWEACRIASKCDAVEPPAKDDR